MIDAAKWAGEPVGNREAYEMLGSITSWQREVAERRRTPSGLLKSAEYQELIDRAIRLFIEGGTINDCTNVMKDIQSLKRSAGPRSQHVNSLLTSCNDLLETWRKNANSLLAEWNGQIKNSPVGGIQARITNLMSAGVKGDKKPGDILTATAKAVQDRFDTEYKDYERAQNPTYRNTSRSAGIIREEMKKLVTLQGTLVEMSQEITQGGDAGIAEQLGRMNRVCDNLDKQG
jgi:hypothetical protein